MKIKILVYNKIKGSSSLSKRESERVFDHSCIFVPRESIDDLIQNLISFAIIVICTICVYKKEYKSSDSCFSQS